MSYTVSLYADDKLSSNKKYRNSFPATQLFSTTNVNIGNFANLNLFCDNSVEIGCAIIVENIVTVPAITIAHQATHIKIEASGFTILGAIIAWDYVNDNNIKFDYVVDAFMSAMLSGKISKAQGYCTRTHIYSEPFEMQGDQPEPFSPSDKCVPNTEVTTDFNNEIANFEGIDISDSGVSAGGTSIIITVSNAIATFCGVSTPFSTPSNPTPELKDLPSGFNFTACDTYVHCGGTFKGLPLKFSSIDAAKSFIDAILSGCGFRTKMASNGYSTMESVTRRMFASTGNDQAAQIIAAHKNWNNDPYEAIRFINGNDIYAMYCIPEAFATNMASYDITDFIVNSFPNISTAFAMSTENNSKGKLLLFPYIYTKLVTANGDTFNIIPQVHCGNDSGGGTAILCYANLRFIGGDTPRLMMRIVCATELLGGTDAGPYSKESCSDWFTVRNYPAVTLSFNASRSIQAERDIMNFKKLAQSYMNSYRQQRIESPIRSGYIDTIKNNNSKHNDENMGAFQQIGYTIGSGAAYLQKGAEKVGAWNGAQILTDKLLEESRAAYGNSMAGNFISPESGGSSGNDFTTQYGIQPVSAYWCGATDAELFSFARYIDEFGQSCNCILNPITNTGDLYGGKGIIYQVDNRTFYQFSHITIEGLMPVAWKEKIAELFESGCYLIG